MGNRLRESVLRSHQFKEKLDENFRPCISDDAFEAICCFLKRSKPSSCDKFFKRIAHILNASDYNDNPFSFSLKQYDIIEDMWLEDDYDSRERYKFEKLLTTMMNYPWLSKSGVGTCYHGNLGRVPENFDEAEALIWRNHAKVKKFLADGIDNYY